MNQHSVDQCAAILAAAHQVVDTLRCRVAPFLENGRPSRHVASERDASGQHIPGSGWTAKATRDHAAIDRMFADPGLQLRIVAGEAPLAGAVALPTGEMLVVLDIDLAGHAANGAEGWSRLEADIGPLPATRTHTTPSGGQHKLFRAPASANIGMAKRGLAAYPGLDIVGKGGLEPFPPSRRVGMPGKEDGAYAILDDLPIAPMPPAFIDLLTRSPTLSARMCGCGDPQDPAVQARAAAIARRCLETLAAARPGERNTTLNTVAFVLGQIERFERHHQATLRQVIAMAKRLGLGDDEITRTVASGRTAGRAEPRDFSDTGLFPNAASTLRWAAAWPLAGTPAETALLNLVPGLVESPPCLRFEPADGVYGDGLLVRIGPSRRFSDGSETASLLSSFSIAAGCSGFVQTEHHRQRQPLTLKAHQTAMTASDDINEALRALAIADAGVVWAPRLDRLHCFIGPAITLVQLSGVSPVTAVSLQSELRQRGVEVRIIGTSKNPLSRRSIINDQ